jgi:hypothetical protein
MVTCYILIDYYFVTVYPRSATALDFACPCRTSIRDTFENSRICGQSRFPWCSEFRRYRWASGDVSWSDEVGSNRNRNYRCKRNSGQAWWSGIRVPCNSRDIVLSGKWGLWEYCKTSVNILVHKLILTWTRTTLTGVAIFASPSSLTFATVILAVFLGHALTLAASMILARVVGSQHWSLKRVYLERKH